MKIATVNPPGNERPLAELYQRVLEGAGIEARVIETPRGASKLGRAAVWGRLPGSGDKPAIALVSHLDVVPADSEGWALPPFSGAIAGGYVIGRGALDAKGVAVVHLLTLLELAQRERPLDRDVIFLATPDEETGGRSGAAYLIDHHADLLDGVGYLLTEGGGILVGEHGAPNIWGITVSEKAPCWMRIVTRGPAGHASSAGPGGATPRLLRAMAKVLDIEMPIRVIPEVERMFAALAPLASAEDRAGYADLRNTLETEPTFRDRFLGSGRRAALVRNTLTPTVLRGGSSTNVVPAEVYAEIDSRLLPGDRCEDLVAAVRERIGDPEVAVETLLSFESNASDAETPLYRAVARVAAEVDPGAFVVPRVIGGFTDAHYFRDLDIVSYGFVPRWLPARETRGVHGKNERISVENLERGIATMTAILEALDREESAN